MPFGLRNAAQTFQRLMNTVLQGLPFAFVYIDDILVASADEAEHFRHLREVFERLQQHGLVIRPEKCEFGKASLDFLGYHVSSSGIQPTKKKVAALASFPEPKTVKQLQRFLGMLNYYHRFVPHAASLLHPLHQLTASKRPNDPIQWNSSLQEVFGKAKTVLEHATLIAHPTSDAPLALCTDASDQGVGASLEQWQAGRWCPLGFFSCHLRKAELKYSAFDKELLAAYLAVRHFRSLLEGRECTLITDHLPLVRAFRKVSDSWSPRQQRHLSALAEFLADVQHRKGEDNVVADCLSRIPVDVVTLGVDYAQLAAAQQSCPAVQTSRTAITGLKFADVSVSGSVLLCDVSTGRPRPLVPLDFRRSIFAALHGLAHPGVRASQQLIGARFVWHGMRRDIANWCKSCTDCLTAKTHRHFKAPVEGISIPGDAFSHVHLDLVGPLPVSRGFKYLLTVIDRTTRWPEAIPIPDATTTTCVRAFLSGWVSRFGLPLHITSDRGSQFTSALWSATAKMFGITLHRTTSYHPQANGLVERFHRSLKASLRARLVGSDWADQLPLVLLGLRVAPKEDLKASAADLVLRHSPMLPGEVLSCRPLKLPDLPLAQSEPRQHGRPASTDLRRLRQSSWVFLRVDAHQGPLERPYQGPFLVTQKSDKTFTLDVRGKSVKVSVDRLKPAPSPSPDDSKVIVTRSGRVSRPRGGGV